MRQGCHTASGVRAHLRSGRALVGAISAISAEGDGRNSRLPKSHERLVEVATGGGRDDLIDSAIELVLTDPAVGVGLLQPVLSSISLL